MDSSQIFFFSVHRAHQILTATNMAKIHARLKEQRKKAGSGSTALQRENPFEAKFTRQKHLVLNRKVKGSRGKPGLARKKSEEAVIKATKDVYFLHDISLGDFIEKRCLET
jgi:hypothetical protein